MNNEEPKLKMETLSLIGTEEQLEKLWNDLAIAGWRLKFQGNSGHWLGEPIYSIRNINEKKDE